MWVLLSWFWGQCPPFLWLLQSFLPLFQGLPQSPERRDPMETSNSVYIMSSCESLKNNLSRWHKICVKQFFQPYQVPEWSQQCSVCLLCLVQWWEQSISQTASSVLHLLPLTSLRWESADSFTPLDQELCPARQQQWPCKPWGATLPPDPAVFVHVAWLLSPLHECFLLYRNNS